jgi:hypothetical protein
MSRSILGYYYMGYKHPLYYILNVYYYNGILMGYINLCKNKQDFADLIVLRGRKHRVHHGDGGGFVMFFKSLAPEIT